MIRPMTASAARSVAGSRYTLGEEIANSITSGIASALSVAALVVMVVHAALRGDGWRTLLSLVPTAVTVDTKPWRTIL